ncbi:MAG: lysostaphin resistance A-like protein [Enterococcus sp.]
MAKKQKKVLNRASLLESLIKPLIVVGLTFTVSMWVGNTIFMVLFGITLFDYTSVEVIQTLSLIGQWSLTLGFVIFCAKKYSQLTTKDLGFSKQQFGRRYLTGTAIGIAMMGSVFLINWALGAINVAVNPQVDWLMIGLLLLFFMVQGLTEEVVIRGYLMGTLEQKFGTVASILLSALVFAGIHSANPGMTLFSTVNLFLAGVAFAILYRATGSIWVAGAVHTMWNFFMGPIFGAEVSGLDLASVFKSDSVSTMTFFNGGSFGFEGGIVVTIVFLATTMIFLPRVKEQLVISVPKLNQEIKRG